MIPPGSELDINIADFASRLLGASETGPRARIIAQVVLERFPATTATIYILQEDDNGPFWSVKASLGEGAEPDPTVNADAGTLGGKRELLEHGEQPGKHLLLLKAGKPYAEIETVSHKKLL